MRGELIREKLHRGERVYGTHVCSLTNPLTAKMESELPFDFIFVCNEHMPIDRTETAMICQFYAVQGISPIVRIPYPEPHWAAMALDAGAQGIVAPYVETIDEVKALVGAVKYRPIKGQFLRDILDARRRPKQKTIDFLNEFNRDNYLIIGVESVEAVRRLDELLAVPGVDGVFMGPHDLTVSLEIPTEYDHPEFIALVEDVIRRSRQKGLGVGLHTQLPNLPPERLKRFLDLGMNWLLNGADITAMRQSMDGQFAHLRKLGGDDYQRQGDPHIKARSCLT